MKILEFLEAVKKVFAIDKLPEFEQDEDIIDMLETKLVTLKFNFLMK